MTRRILPGKLWLLSLLLCGCTPALSVKPMRTGAIPGKHRILILKSGENPLFALTIKTFSEQLTAGISQVTLPPKVSPSALREALSTQRPDLILAMGLRAATAARDAALNLPILFTMVPNWQNHGLSGHRNMMGIALETPPTSDFMQFKMVLPNLKKVLFIYTPEIYGGKVSALERELTDFGVELVARPARDLGEVKAAYESTAKAVDGIWLHNDPVVMNAKAFDYLKSRSLTDRIALFSSLSEQFTQAGALASVALDLKAMGSQAATMVTRVLVEGESPAEIGVQPPVGGLLWVNLEVVQRLGIEVPSEVLPFFNRVIAAKRT